MIYLISAYSGTEEQQEQRFLDVEKDVAYIMGQGLQVFSPIVYAHAMAKKYDLPKDAKYWEKFNDFMQDKMISWVRLTPDTINSIGCQREIKRTGSFSAYRNREELTLLVQDSLYKQGAS
jgi:hypothetical protein